MTVRLDDLRARLGEVEREAGDLRRTLFDARAAAFIADGSLQILVLKAGAIALGVPVHAVREVVQVPFISTVPGAADPVVGVVNYRGGLVPVLDLRCALGSAAPPFSPDSYLAVLASDGASVAVVVDDAGDLTSYGTADLETSPVAAGAPAYLFGVMRDGERPVFVLDPAGLLEPGEMARLCAAASGGGGPS